MMKCTMWKKKLLISEEFANKCKCGNYYCSKHIFYTYHNCEYDYINNNKNNMSSNVIKLIDTKNYIII